MWAEQKSSDLIPLSAPTWDSEELLEAMDSLLRGQLTMGKKVAMFEQKFAEYVGTSGAVMVNSGSSANLLAMMLITNPETADHLRPGDEVITPAVTWSTTVFSILAAGLTPVLVDVDPETLLMDIEEVERAISNRTGGIFCVHLLGNPCDLKALSSIAEERNLFLIEDACEAHGAQVERNKKVGSFGDLSTFSFFFSHHITTIEGGMVLADDDETLDILRTMRAHGWIRERADRRRIEKTYPRIDPRFLFANIGFNLRPTEIQGAFGIHQLKKLEGFINIRRRNAKVITEHLRRYAHVLRLPDERRGTRHVFFGYPIVVNDDSGFEARELQKFLETQRIDTRPIMSGNIVHHPALKLFPVRQVSDLANADFVAQNGFFFGIHHAVQRRELNRIREAFDNFMEDRGI
ncbi:MAG: DegT/DnrJ/EryC1/StrS family aminotransferase [Thermoplasmata archaeon]